MLMLMLMLNLVRMGMSYMIVGLVRELVLFSIVQNTEERQSGKAAIADCAKPGWGREEEGEACRYKRAHGQAYFGFTSEGGWLRD